MKVPRSRQPAASSQHAKPQAEKRGGETSQHSAESRIRKRDKEYSHHSAEDQYWQNSDACATDHRAAVQEKTEMRHRDREPHSGGRSLTANNDHAVTEYHTTSTVHAVAESLSPADQKEKARCCKVPDRGGTSAPTANQRPRSSAVLRCGLEVPLEAFAEWETATK